jgi:hypothetical protein
MTRTAWIVTGSLGALLGAAIIVGIIILGEIRAQETQRAFEDCMARHGHAVDDEMPAIDNDDDLDAYMNDRLIAADRCAA